jgi:cobalt-zinc-cadmium efflux system protein
LGHGHHHHHHEESKNILLAFFLNAGFCVVEFIGGYLTNSVAIYSDALHDLGDSIALLFSFFAEKLAKKEADQKFTFGYRRFSILSALINGLILLTGSFYVIYEAIQRINAPQEVKAEGMILIALLGIAVNLLAVLRLKNGKSSNVKMVMYHLLEDLLGWIAVLVVSIVLMFKPWFVLDSILSILISLVILRGVYKNTLKSLLIFLQKFPDELEVVKLKDEILKIHEIKDVHAIKGWAMDDSNFYLRLHVVVSDQTTMEKVDFLKSKIKELLKEQNVVTSTIEFEGEGAKDCD